MQFYAEIRVVNEKTGKALISTHHCYLSESEMNEIIKKIQYIFDTDYDVPSSNETYCVSATITQYGDVKEIFSKKLSNRSATEKDIWLKRHAQVLDGPVS